MIMNLEATDRALVIAEKAVAVAMIATAGFICHSLSVAVEITAYLAAAVVAALFFLFRPKHYRRERDNWYEFAPIPVFFITYMADGQWHALMWVATAGLLAYTVRIVIFAIQLVKWAKTKK